MGQVRQDRDVVGDRVDAVEGEAVRGRLDDRGRVAGDQHRAQGALELGCLRGRGVGLVGRLDTTDPGRGRAGHPGPDPGRLEGRGGEERGGRLAVRAGDPDDRQLVHSDRGTTTPRPWRGPRRVSSTTSWGRSRSGRARSTRATDGTGAGRGGRRNRVRRREGRGRPRTATRPRPPASRWSRRVTGIAARPAAPIARPSRRAPRSRPSAVRRAISPPSSTGSERSAAASSSAIVFSVIGPPAVLRGRPGARAGSRCGSKTRSWAPVSSSHSPPNDCLCWYSP